MKLLTAVLLAAFLGLAACTNGDQAKDDQPSSSSEAAVEATAAEAPAAAPAAATADPNTVTAAALGDEWPFNGITSGTVECIDGMYAVLHADDGNTYALNGAANSAARTGEMNFKRIEPIWRDNPSIPGLKVDIGPILSKATALCN